MAPINSTYLERCSNPGCRAFILNTDVKCAHCGTERGSLKVVRPLFGLCRIVVIPLVLLALFVWFYHFCSAAKERRQDSEWATKHGLNP